VNRFLYLFVDLLSVFLPFAFSFYPKANFSSKWRYLWPAIILSAGVFVSWDMAFTGMGVWGFNAEYITGVHLHSLPIEEVLFFICIPYSCVFLYEAMKHFVRRDLFQPYSPWISAMLVCFLLAVGLWNMSKWYTSVSFVSCGLAIIIAQWILKSPFMGRFYFTYMLTLIPFFMVNGVLTGSVTAEPVVWYDEAEFLGIRIGTIPFEDVFYGMLMILTNICLFEGFQSRSFSHIRFLQRSAK
jgi:lycopene cyclase domain-containing protein